MEGETHTGNTSNEGEGISDERYAVENQDLEEDSDGLYDPSSERQTQGKQFSVWKAPEIYVDGVNDNVFSKKSTRRWTMYVIIFLLIGAGVVSALFAKSQAHNEELTKEIESMEIQLNEAKSRSEEYEKQLNQNQSVNSEEKRNFEDEEKMKCLIDWMGAQPGYSDLQKAFKKGYHLILKFYEWKLKETEWETHIGLIVQAVYNSNVGIVQYLLEIEDLIEDIPLNWAKIPLIIEPIQRIVTFSLKHGLGKLALNVYGEIMWKAEYDGLGRWWLKCLGQFDLEKIKLLKQSELDTMGQKHQDTFKKRSQQEFVELQKWFGDSHEIVHLYKTKIL